MLRASCKKSVNDTKRRPRNEKTYIVLIKQAEPPPVQCFINYCDVIRKTYVLMLRPSGNDVRYLYRNVVENAI